MANRLRQLSILAGIAAFVLTMHWGIRVARAAYNVNGGKPSEAEEMLGDILARVIALESQASKMTQRVEFHGDSLLTDYIREARDKRHAEERSRATEAGRGTVPASRETGPSG